MERAIKVGDNSLRVVTEKNAFLTRVLLLGWYWRNCRIEMSLAILNGVAIFVNPVLIIKTRGLGLFVK
jgi:hypothetical protein